MKHFLKILSVIFILLFIIQTCSAKDVIKYCICKPYIYGSDGTTYRIDEPYIHCSDGITYRIDEPYIHCSNGTIYRIDEPYIYSSNGTIYNKLGLYIYVTDKNNNSTTKNSKNITNNHKEMGMIFTIYKNLSIEDKNRRNDEGDYNYPKSIF